MAKKKLTYAQVSDRLSKKIGKLEKDLKSSDKQAKETAKLILPRLQEKMNKLYKNQEDSKKMSFQKEQSKLMAKYGYGGDIKMANGGDVTDNAISRFSQDFNNTNLNIPDNYFYPTEATRATGTNNTETVFSQSSSKASSPRAYDQSKSDLYNQYKNYNYDSQIGGSIGYQDNQIKSEGDRTRGNEGSYGDSRNTLNTLGKYAPTIYNAFKGIQKPDQYDKGTYYNPYEDEAMKLLRERKYNIEPQLEANNRSYSASRESINQGAAGNSAAYLGALGSAQQGKIRADAGAYANKNNIDNQYKAQEAQAVTGFGQGRVGADRYTDDLNARNRAIRDAYQGAAATGISDISQYNTRENNRNSADQQRIDLLNQYFADYGFQQNGNSKRGEFYYKG